MTRFYMMFLLCLTAIANAQLPHTFTQIVRTYEGGEAYGIELGPDGTLFLANGDGGLRAYNYNGISFTNTA
ncbi:MAG: hypothetical protein R3C26_20295 [Calditrichia bacterium]